MNFQQIDFSYISTRSTNDSICTDDDIDDFIENVLKSIDEYKQTSSISPTNTKTDHETSNDETEPIESSTATTNAPSNSINYYKFGLFSPNPFYPCQPLPIPQLSQASTSLSPSCPTHTKAFKVKHNLKSHRRLHIGEQPLCPKTFASKSSLNGHPTLKYLMHKLIATDDDSDGQLDLQEFTEAIHGFDTDIDDNDIEDIFTSMCKGKQNEISINKCIEYIRCNCSQTSTPKNLFRSAFPGVFGKQCEIWGSGIAQTNLSGCNDMELQQTKKEMEHELEMMLKYL